MRLRSNRWLLLLAMFLCVLRMVSCGHEVFNCSDVVDCTTLRQLKAEASPSKLDRLWDESRHHCEWPGVTCTGSGQVSGLDLKFMSLRGPVPAAVGKLSQIASLDLSNNLLTQPGGISQQWLDELPHLTLLDLSNNADLGAGTALLPDRFPANLTYLNLSWCGLAGEIPQGLAHLPFLTTLSLSHNLLNGTIPHGLLGQLQGQVQVLDLSYNFLQGSIPDAFGSLSFCKGGYLSLAGNNLTGTLPSSLSGWTELAVLDVQRNNLWGPFPAHLGELIASGGRLEVLKLSHNSFTGSLQSTTESLASCSPEGLGTKSLQCCNLREVGLDSNNLEGSIPRELISYCTGLTTLSLRHNKLSGNLVGNVSAGWPWSSLKHLDLSFNRFSGEIQGEWISRFESLEKLILGHNNLSGAIPRELGELRSLQVLQLSTNQLEGVIPPELENCNFTFLSLSNNKLQGQIPAWLGQLRHLRFMDLSANLLSSIPQELYLSLTSNGQSLTATDTTLERWKREVLIRELEDYLPLTDRTSQFLKAELETVDQRTSLWSPPSLIIDVSYNKLAGQIPDLHMYTILKLGRIRYLDMSHNNLSGRFPAALLLLLGLSFLDLSWNRFGGQIPIGALQVRNFSYLNLDCNYFENADKAASFFPRQKNMFRDLSSCDRDALTAEHHVHGPGVHRIVALAVVLLLVLVVLIGVLRNVQRAQFCCTPWKPASVADGACAAGDDSGAGSAPHHNRNASEDCTGAAAAAAERDANLKVSPMMAPSRTSSPDHHGGRMDSDRQFYILLDEEVQQETDMHDIVTATNNFNAANILGYGGFGMVYKACLPNGQVLAVKKLRSGGQQGEREFQAEIRTLGKIRHRNLVELKGYCRYNEERLLVYSFMENRCLDWWLHQADDGVSVLDWPKRLRIAHGAASGLCFLHHFLVPRIIHRDIKASNILLDATFTAHIADFGLARILEPSSTHLTTTVSGTLGYIDPASLESSTSTLEMDVYSFGVVLLELVTGRRANVQVKEHGTRSLAKWVHLLVFHHEAVLAWDTLLDPVLRPHMLERPLHYSQAQQLVILGCRCTHENPALRPSMRNVVKAIDDMLAYDTDPS